MIWYFFNPFLLGERRVYHDSHIREWMNLILKECDFNRRYTQYSLRSTHISYQLLQGVPVNKVAKNVGTSMEMIQKTYDGLFALYSIDELDFFKVVKLLKDKDEGEWLKVMVKEENLRNGGQKL